MEGEAEAMVARTLDGETTVVADWLSTNLHGRVRSTTRQPRWRPQWIADVETADGLLSVMVRGERYDTDMVWPLKHENDVQANHG
jgi:hypothetical protein